jgi:cation diffusion facilitator family transporter
VPADRRPEVEDSPGPDVLSRMPRRTAALSPPDGGGRTDESVGTVVVALAANAVQAAAKLVGGLLSGSHALLAEAAHSVADTLNECLLLAAAVRGRRAADATHPFGHGLERFFWSLLAAVGLFVTGACYSAYQGIQALTGTDNTRRYVVVYAVLAISLAADGSSLARALLQARRDAHRAGQTMRARVRGGDPMLSTILAEDGIGITGSLLATVGVAIHQTTGYGAAEGIAALAIAVLLGAAAVGLGRQNMNLLTGQSADIRLQLEAWNYLAAAPGIDTVLTVATMVLSQDQVLLAARVDLADGMDSDGVEAASGRIKAGLVKRLPVLSEVFLDITDATPADETDSARRLAALRRAVAVETR